MEWEQGLGVGEFDRLLFDAEYSTDDYRAAALTKLHEAPVINPYSLFFWRAYHELETERAVGMDTGPIPFGSIIRYATEFNLVGDEREALLRIIRALDNRWLNLRESKRRKAEKEQQSKSTSGSTGGTVVDSW